MTNPKGFSNRRRGDEFRTEVLLAFHEAGLSDARRQKFKGGTLSANLTEDPGDIAGIPGWSLTVLSGTGQHMSGSLARAEASAEFAGNPFAATILTRRGYPVGGSYVVTTFDCFTEVLCRMNP